MIKFWTSNQLVHSPQYRHSPNHCLEYTLGAATFSTRQQRNGKELVSQLKKVIANNTHSHPPPSLSQPPRPSRSNDQVAPTFTPPAQATTWQVSALVTSPLQTPSTLSTWWWSSTLPTMSPSSWFLLSPLSSSSLLWYGPSVRIQGMSVSRNLIGWKTTWLRTIISMRWPFCHHSIEFPWFQDIWSSLDFSGSCSNWEHAEPRDRVEGADDLDRGGERDSSENTLRSKKAGSLQERLLGCFPYVCWQTTGPPTISSGDKNVLPNLLNYGQIIPEHEIVFFVVFSSREA